MNVTRSESAAATMASDAEASSCSFAAANISCQNKQTNKQTVRQFCRCEVNSVAANPPHLVAAAKNKVVAGKRTFAAVDMSF